MVLQTGKARMFGGSCGMPLYPLLANINYRFRLCLIIVFPFQQNINISSWIGISGSNVYFPIKLKNDNALNLSQNKLSILIEANFVHQNVIQPNIMIQVAFVRNLFFKCFILRFSFLSNDCTSFQ